MAFRATSRTLIRRARLVAAPVVITQARRFATIPKPIVQVPSWRLPATAILGAAVIGAGTVFAAEPVDYAALRKDIVALLSANPNYEDGSYGPLFIRLAWHQAGTYSKADGSGGSEGGRIRFDPEKGWGANAGLGLAMKLLEPLKQKYPGVSYADLYSLAGSVAIEEAGNVKVNWKPGRVDLPDGTTSPPDGRLPDAAQGAQHLRNIFNRMGFNDQEIVALSGAHSMGRCHTDRSGFEGPWTKSPTMLSNDYYRELLETTWTERKWNGPKQYADPAGELMMLPSDLALIQDPEMKKWVELYAKDETKFLADFAKAWEKLQTNGVAALQQKPWWKVW